MFLQNIRLAARSLFKNKMVTGINILGLTIGVTISLQIFVYVRKEKTIDTYIPDHENIYILMNNGDPDVSKRMIDMVKQDVPEIGTVTFCNYEWSPQVFLRQNNTDFKVNKLLVADSAFFRVFRFEPVWGDPASALNNANQIVLTQSLAKRIFGDDNPVGRALIYNSTYLQNEILEVSAVIKDLSDHSSWEFDAVLPVEANAKIDWYANLLKSWGTQNYSAFFRINDNTDPALLKEKLAGIPTAEIPEKYKDATQFGLFPFTGAYFGLPGLTYTKHGNLVTVRIIYITGIMILLLACVNYVNLVTAQREKRLKSIGVMKTLGSNRQKIIALMTTESTLVLLFTLLLTLQISPLLLGILNSLTGSQFTFQSLFSGWNLAILAAIFVFTLIVTGFMPGYLFCKYNTTLLLKNQTKNNQGNYLRNGLLVFQFAVSIALISGILFINRQNKYLNNLNPGFEKDHIIYASINERIQENIQSFKNEIGQISGISGITFSSEPLGNIQKNWGTDLINKGDRQEIGFANLWVSPNFFDFFGIRFKKGATFTENSVNARDFIFNESAIRQFNINDLSDARVIVTDKPDQGRIIGEVEDFNFESMHVSVRAAGFMSENPEEIDVVYLKLIASDYLTFQQIIKPVEKIWKNFSPDFPFEFRFLDASWEALYRKDFQFQRILSYATVISLFLSCLGLTGLTFFVMENRTKEIGIRKVHGAGVSEILAIVNKDFVRWVAIAFVIATPVAWYAVNQWLRNFAYKTDLSWWIFALAALLALGIALLTVSFQSWKAAMRNPVEALRYE